jgi:hypothetical protein
MIAQDMLHPGHHFDGRQRYVEDLTLGRDLSLHAQACEDHRVSRETRRNRLVCNRALRHDLTHVAFSELSR